METNRMMMTEVRVKDEASAVVLPHGELKALLKEEQVEAVYKYGAFDRDVQGQVKAVHDLTKGPYKGYDSSRPRASSVISSQNPDRDRDVIRSGGMILSDAYMKGPQVLPMHSREFPVGMARRFKQSAKSIWAEWEWLVDQEYTQATTFQQAWDAYVLNSTSVGFMPTEIETIPDSYGFDFKEWELLEFSPVIIPANADAMRTDGLKGLLKAFGDAIMDGPSPIAKRLWEEALAKASPKQVATGIIGGASFRIDVDTSEAMRKLSEVEEKMVTVTRSGEPGGGFAQVRVPVSLKGSDDPDLALAKEQYELEIDGVEVSDLSVDRILGAFVAGAILREEAQKAIEDKVKAAEVKASQYKREAENLAARLIKAEVR